MKSDLISCALYKKQLTNLTYDLLIFIQITLLFRNGTRDRDIHRRVQSAITNSSQCFPRDLLRTLCPCNYPLNCLSPSTVLRPETVLFAQRSNNNTKIALSDSITWSTGLYLTNRVIALLRWPLFTVMFRFTLIIRIQARLSTVPSAYTERVIKHDSET